MALERRDSAHIDERATSRLVLAREAADAGDDAEIVSLTRTILEEPTSGYEFREEAYALGVEAAQMLGDEAALGYLDEFVNELRPAEATPLLRAAQARVRAALAERNGDETRAREQELTAIAMLRDLGARPLLADTLVEFGRRNDDAEAIGEARAIYSELGATRRLAQIDEPSGLAA
jgi:hypothetical protein